MSLALFVYENEELVLATINRPARRNAEKREDEAASAWMSPVYASRSRSVMLKNAAFEQPQIDRPQKPDGVAGCSHLLVELWYWDAPSYPLMSQDAKTGPAFWRSCYAFCNAICTSSPAAIYSADRLSSFLLLLHLIRIRGPARRSRPTADGLQISSPVLQVSSRLSCHRKCSRAAGFLRAHRDMFGPQHPFAVPGRSLWEIRDRY